MKQILCLLFLIVTITGCKKLVEAPLPSELVAGENVFSSTATSVAVLNGLYSSMQGDSPYQGVSSISYFTGLSSDELTMYSGVSLTSNTGQAYQNNIFQNTPIVPGIQNGNFNFWTQFYKNIFKCNGVIEGLNSTAAKALNIQVQQQLLGEAKFVRALNYFYLVNLFGDLPLCITTDAQVNIRLKRVPVQDVYSQIISDLLEAKNLLSTSFLGSSLLDVTTERVRPTKWAASALLARVYLFNNQPDKAETEANVVIANSSFGLVALNNVFLKNSNEAIWQLQPTAGSSSGGLVDYNKDAYTFIIPSTGPNNNSNPVFFNKSWLKNFESGDQRAVLGNWIGRTIYPISSTNNDTVYYSYKYKQNSPTTISSLSQANEYFMVLRLGEQYLIRAEARALQNNISGAQADLNTIRSRAGLPATTASDKNSLLDAILKERKVELFCELGQRWFDLKRTGNVNAVMSMATPLKSGGTVVWRSYQALYPIPTSELQNDPFLVQNPGY